MSNIYIQEPPTTGKVMMKTSFGDIDLELWTKEAPKACRNFIQLCMEGYYDNTIFHRIVKGFIAQGGDPTGTGEGGESIYGQPFKDEFHTRLRFCRRGLLAMANAGKDDNGSQFFFTLAATPELQNKHTIFGKVTGETVYNILKLEEALIDEDDRPIYPQKIIKTQILNNPFEDIVPRSVPKRSEKSKEKEKAKKSGVKNFKLLSFGEEAEEDEEEFVELNKQYSGKGKSAHDSLEDPKLSAEPAIGPPHKKKREDRSSDWESGDDERTPEELAVVRKEREEIKGRIKDKLKAKKSSKESSSKQFKVDDKEVVESIDASDDEEYYLGKDEEKEQKRKAEAIRKEIRDLKRGVQNEKKVKEAGEKQKLAEKEEEKKRTDVFKEYRANQEKYKTERMKVPKKGAARQDITLNWFANFRKKLHDAKEQDSENGTSNSDAKQEKKVEDDEDATDESWLSHAFQCEDKEPVLARDASLKDDDWFEIYDPRNPINKRRRGETSKKSEGDRSKDRFQRKQS